MIMEIQVGSVRFQAVILQLSQTSILTGPHHLWLLFLVCTWRHGGHVGLQDNSVKSIQGI